MIAINAYEKEIITQKYPDVHIVRTMKKDSKRHHFYMAELSGPMRMLRVLRAVGVQAETQVVKNS